MKKILSLVLVLVMVLSMATMASAAEKTDTFETDPESGETAWNTTNTSQGVITTDVTGEVATVYKVTVEWDSLSFTYNFAGQTWNPDNHTYGGTVTGWNGATSTVKVTNHSNAAIQFSATITDQDPADDVNVVFDGYTEGTWLELATADEGASLGDTTKAPNQSITYKPAGTPAETWVDGTTIATITVTIKAK